MSRSTQNVNLRTVVSKDDKKLSSAQQKQWSSMVVAKMTQAFKATSINNVIWGNQGKK